MTEFPIISLLTFTPLLGAILAYGLGDQKADRICYLVSAIVGALSLVLGLNLNLDTAGYQAVESYAWIPTLNLNYEVGVDGLSLMMIWLTALLIPTSLLIAKATQNQRKLYVALVLLLETGLIGTFTALNFFHWFLYWELSLIPAFFLVRIWGGQDRHEASVQFFVYTFVGSVGLLLSFVALFAATGTFNFTTLAELARDGNLLNAIAQFIKWPDVPVRIIGVILFGLAFLGVAVKVPLYPFHTWLPSTYEQAPSAVTLLLTGLMSKMGVYALLRLIVPIFHTQLQLVATPLIWLAVLTIVISAFAAYRQDDLKRVFAYSSINHLGYCFLAVFAIASTNTNDEAWLTEASAAFNGVILQMFNHGVIAGFIFFLIGRLEERTAGIRGVNDFGGLRSCMPLYSTAFGIALFASLGLPGLSAFVGEFLMFKGSFALVPWASALATVGLLMTAVFILDVLRKVVTGPPSETWSARPDLTTTEKMVVIPALLLMLAGGVFPQLLIRFFNTSSVHWISQLGGGQ